MKYKGVVFDMDGTLVKLNLDFEAIKREIGVTEGTALEYLRNLPEQDRKKGFAILERHEKEAAESAVLNDGARELLEFLEGSGLKKAIVTRNTRKSAGSVLAKHGLEFDAVVTRDDAPVKPSKEPLLIVSRKLGVGACELLMVGDYKYDITAGTDAGMDTVLLLNGKNTVYSNMSDYCVSTLLDIIPILSPGT